MDQRHQAASHEARRYAVWFAGPTWVPAFWSPERGWTDGLKALHGVRAYYPVPDVPQAER